MQWQDIVISICVVFFVLALIPSLKSNHKPAIQTSLLTGFLNFVVASTEITLGLWFSALVTFICGSLWLILAYQKFKLKT